MYPAKIKPVGQGTRFWTTNLLISVLAPVSIVLLRVPLHSLADKPPADLSSDAEQHIVYADAALHDGEQLLAESEYRAGISAALESLGNRELARGNSSFAKQAFTEAARVVAKPNAKLQAYLKVKKNIDSSSLTDRTFPALTKSSAGATSAAGKVEERIRTDVARAYFNLGLMQGKRGRFRRAARFLGRAAYWGPDLPNVEYSLGLALFNAKEYKAAVDPLQQALNQNPASVPRRKQLALACYRAEDYGCVTATLSSDSELLRDPNAGYIAGYVLAVSLTRSGRPEEGERLLSELLNQYSDSADFLVLVGQGYAEQNDDARALAILQRAVQVDSNALEAHSTAGLIYLRTGKFAEAEAEFQKELRVNPSDLTAKVNLAFVLTLEQKDDEALSLLKSVLQAQPNSSEAHYTLAKLLSGQGKLELALEHAQTAVQLSPEDERKHYQLAQICAKLGRTDEAQRQLATYRLLKEKPGTTQ